MFAITEQSIASRYHDREELRCQLAGAMQTAEHGFPSRAGSRLVDALTDYVASRADGDDGLTCAYLDHVAQIAHMVVALRATVQA